MAQKVIESTTQQFLDIYDITDDVMILKDGSSSIVLTVNAMNFGLLAEPEQDAIMYAYAGLLNSLNYPVQIVIRSQTKDVTSYLNLLKEEEDKSTSQVKRQWISRYRTFVGQLIKERNVLDKKFYVVVSASSLEMGLLPPSTVVPGVKQPDLSTIERSVILEKAREILEPRRDHLLGQLGRIGLFGKQLTTQEIIQLFYLSYNPEAAEGQQITDTQSYTTPMVEASVQGGFMDTTNTAPTPVTSSSMTDTTAAPTTPTSTVPSTPSMPATPPSTPEPTTPAMPSMPSAPSVTPTPPAMPGTGMPTTPTITPPTSSSIPSPANTSPSMPTPPAASPSTSPTTPAEMAAQNEINSTIQQLGSMPTTPTTPSMSATPSMPSMSNPSDTPSIGTTPTVPPAASSTPASSLGGAPTTSSTGSAGSSDTSAKTDDTMPPLPEI